VGAARGVGCTSLALLKCTSTYPADPRNSNLSTIPHMAARFGCPVGLSDHTLGIGVAVAATALGACMIEKHVTLHRTEGGVDSAFSLEPEELAQLIRESTAAWQALGQVQYGPTRDELPSLQYRRSLYVVEDVERGETLDSRNVRAIRPGLGLPPKHLDAVLGRRTSKRIPRGTPLSWDLID
jgi:N-acetylneuraminate synthase